MGAHDHLTAKPAGWEPPMETKREQLMDDLRELSDTIESVEPVDTCRNAVTFTAHGEMPGDIPNGVLRVLADHGAMIPREQPDGRNDHHAYIELDN
jgi:hypothetical protein